KPLWRKTTRTSGPHGLNLRNRRMRTRMYGGVAGESGRPLPPMPISFSFYSCMGFSIPFRRVAGGAVMVWRENTHRTSRRADCRDRRRTLRYRQLLMRQMVQMKNRISGLLMETGVSYNKRRLHKVKYFHELLTTNHDIDESIRPLLKLSRETIVRLQKTEYALVSSLQRDPLLSERIQHLRTVPGVAPITALTWALEMGDVSLFRSIRHAISYGGFCGDEKSSADKVMRTPLSKQRNKHIQRVLVEAAKLAPKEDHDLALVYEKEKQKGNANRATLAVARKMVAYLLAVDRG